jgi:C-terminal processing protease CtpA/Prc
MPARIDSRLQSVYKTWLNNANPAVKDHLVRSKPVSVFTDSVDRRYQLSKQQRLRIVDQALVLLEQTYVHLPLKRAIHAIDPIQRLRLLRFRLDQINQEEMSDSEFHREILETFMSVRDIHTHYVLPRPYRGHVAYLPFLVEQYFEKSVPKFMVSHLADGFAHQYFKKGIEVLYWNGVPIRRAIEENGERQAGSNPEARFAWGLAALTIRDLQRSLPPDEEWVTVTYRTRDGVQRDIKLEWLVVPTAAGKKKKMPKKAGAARKSRLAVDRHRETINQMRKILYAPKVVELERKCEEEWRKKKRVTPRAPRSGALRTKLPSVFRAEKMNQGKLGYIRIFAFDSDRPDIGADEIVNEFARLVRKLPDEGLVIDVRGNSGGLINAGERLLQLFTPRRIAPELFEFINTPLTLRISLAAPKYEDMARFAGSIRESVVTSATFSAGFPLTSAEDCNSIGQVYSGPVVLITDALCYSTTDIFTAGFQDNHVGTVLGTSGNTGAGGAEVISQSDLRSWMRTHPDSPFATLPNGAEMSVAIRRSLRVGRRSGRPLEELGIIPDSRYHMTKRDLRNNQDLRNRAARILARMRPRRPRRSRLRARWK